MMDDAATREARALGDHCSGHLHGGTICEDCYAAALGARDAEIAELKDRYWSASTDLAKERDARAATERALSTYVAEFNRESAKWADERITLTRRMAALEVALREARCWVVADTNEYWVTTGVKPAMLEQIDAALAGEQEAV